MRCLMRVFSFALVLGLGVFCVGCGVDKDKPSVSDPVDTTAATTATTTRPTESDASGAWAKDRPVRILAIGNSFSVDAMEAFLYRLISSAGYTDITLGNLYIGGCSLDTHWQKAQQMSPAYIYYSNTDGNWSTTKGVDISYGLDACEWDVITVQQASHDSGQPETYANLQAFVNWIKEKQPQAKVYFHMTWAYQQDSTHPQFPRYDSDQMTMYRAICDTVRQKVLTVNGIEGVIPAGTAIQNFRTSSVGDTITDDGYHLSAIGDYVAALTWCGYLLGNPIAEFTFSSYTTGKLRPEIDQAVENALREPFAVTLVADKWIRKNNNHLPYYIAARYQKQ